MPAVKTDMASVCCRRLLFSHRNGIAGSTGSRVGVMSQVARRYKALPIISNVRPRNPCAKSLYPFPSQFKVGSLQASLQVLNIFVYIVSYGVVV